jgi:hypothetical protein
MFGFFFFCTKNSISWCGSNSNSAINPISGYSFLRRSMRGTGMHVGGVTKRVHCTSDGADMLEHHTQVGLINFGGSTSIHTSAPAIALQSY